MIPPYPFTAVVGLADLRLALLLNAVSPAVGGVLVRGEKGTAKSTMVRALAALLPIIDVVPGCRFACEPDGPVADCPDGPHAAGAAVARRARLVELPVGATEDRLVGSLDLERALTEGTKAYEPGLLAAAHRGLLYVDEVNLLHDHLVDLLLDAAAMGAAYVERDGVSVQHPARFLLVGTMNPEEGELRPQLLDRFGLTVDVRAPRDAEQRAEVVRRRLAYEADPAGFVAGWAAAEGDLATRIAAARARLGGVVLPDAELMRIARVCAAFDVDGLRADIVVARAAVAHAAWSGRAVVTTDDVRVAARLALPHRKRRDPFDTPGVDDEALDDALEDPPPPEDDGPGGAPPPDCDRPADGGSAREGAAEQGEPFRARRIEAPRASRRAGEAGRRSSAYTRNGRVVGARVPDGRATALHLPATVYAAAPHQRARGRVAGRLRLAAGDLREPVRQGREANLVLFAVDASGSMAARQRMRAVTGAVMSLLRDAYQRRDTVGLVTFRADGARLVLPPTASVDAAAARLRDLPTGGRTPLAAGLSTAAAAVRHHRLRDPLRRPLLVVVTDGRVTTGPDPLPVAARIAAEGIPSVVVDCESGPVRLGLAGRLAGALRASYLTLGELSADTLRGLARRAA